MTDELKTGLQNELAPLPIVPPVAVTPEPNASAVVPAPTTPEPSAPPQAETPKPKGKDAAARINELIAKVKISADDNEQLRAEIQRLKSGSGAGGPEGTAPRPQPENPYAPVGTGPSGEVMDEDLESMSPAMKKDHDELQRILKEQENAKAQTALEQSLASNFEAYPEIQGVVDDNSIGLEASKRRLPLFNVDLLFRSRALDVQRERTKTLEAENAVLRAELHKDDVATPSSGNLQPAPPDKTGKVYAPGERMAEAKQKAAKG